MRRAALIAVLTALAGCSGHEPAPTDANGAVLRIRIEPSRYQGLLTAAPDRPGSNRSSWGLHPLDISLVQGNMLAMLGAQAEAWGR